MKPPPFKGGGFISEIGLHSNEEENSVSESQPGGDSEKDRNEHTDPSAEEEQPHAPTRNILRHRYFHFTLSLKMKLVPAELPVQLM